MIGSALRRLDVVAFAPDVRGEPPPGRRETPARSGRRAQVNRRMGRRRKARAAFRAAARLVEEQLDLKAIPAPGAERLPGRPIACHIAAEVFDLRPYEVARAAGVDRRTASCGQYRIWDRRDIDPGMDGQIAGIVQALKIFANDPRLMRDVAMAKESRK